MTCCSNGPRRRGLGWWLVGALVALLGAGVYALSFFIQIDVPYYEREAGRYFGRPVHIGAASFTLAPLPSVSFSDVTIGAGEVRIASARAAMDMDMVWTSDRHFKLIELQGVTVPDARILPALFGSAESANVGFDRILATDVRIATPFAKLPPFSVKADVDRSRRLSRIEMQDRASSFYVTLTAAGAGRESVEIQSASFAVPFGAPFMLTDFGARGELTRTGLTLSGFDARLFGGVIKGTAQLNFTGPWTLNGKLEAKVLELSSAAPQIFSGGRANGTASFSMTAAGPGELFGAPVLQGNFDVSPSTVTLIDLGQSLDTRQEVAAGTTQLDGTSGEIQIAGRQIRIRNVLMTAGKTTALGNFDVDASRGALGGRMAIEAPGVDGPRRAGFSFAGTVDRPVLKRTN